MLAGFDEDLAEQINQVSNRIRGLLTHIHPALERAIGPNLSHPAGLDLLQRHPTPSAMQAAGRRRLETRLVKLAPRLAGRLATSIVAALKEQTVVVAGTAAAGQVLPRFGRAISDTAPPTR